MRNGLACLAALAFATLYSAPAKADVIYNNLTPNNQIAVAVRPNTAGLFEIEAGDDFVLGSRTIINSASFVGLIVPGPTGGSTTITDLVIEMYRIFPLDSNAARVPNVPTRTNSPSDVAFDSRDSGAGELTFNSATLNASFTALNSVQPGAFTPLRCRPRAVMAP